jgi:hypothetical protein
MDEKVLKWSKTTIIAALGGGFAAAFTAAMDPSKYRFPNDLGSGKLWPYFFQGAGLIFVGLILKSPFGQKVLADFKQARSEMAESQADIAQAKAELKGQAQPGQKGQGNEQGSNGKPNPRP